MEEVQSNESVGGAVVRAISKETGTPPTMLEPLSDWIDPDALDTVFAPTASGNPRSGRIVFRYTNYEVTAIDGESISIETITPDAEGYEDSIEKAKLND